MRRTKGKRVSEGGFTRRGDILAVGCHALSAGPGDTVMTPHAVTNEGGDVR